MNYILNSNPIIAAKENGDNTIKWKKMVKVLLGLHNKIRKRDSENNTIKWQNGYLYLNIPDKKGHGSIRIS